MVAQRWRDVAFLHWPLDPSTAAPLLPPGTRPDELDGRTFVGVVALEMARTRVLGGPPLPWLGTFGQVNVRLYSVDREGRRGVVFLSLTADRMLPALAARVLTGLPYAWGRVGVQRTDDRRTYTARSGAGDMRIALRIGPRREPGALELFVAARWGLHTRMAGRGVYIAVEHRPWTLHTAELDEFDGDLLAAAGLPGVSSPPESVLFSPGVAARIGPAR